MKTLETEFSTTCFLSHMLTYLASISENFGPGLAAAGLSAADSIRWAIDATLAARAVLGPTRLIAHAPQGLDFECFGINHSG
jgi:hypothetical protein